MLHELGIEAENAEASDVEKEIALESSFASLLEAMLKLWEFSAKGKKESRECWPLQWKDAKRSQGPLPRDRTRQAELQRSILLRMRAALVEGLLNGIFEPEKKKKAGEPLNVGALVKTIAAAAEQAKNLRLLGLFSEGVGQRVALLKVLDKATEREIADLQAKIRKSLAVKRAAHDGRKAEFRKVKATAKLEEQKRATAEAKAELEEQKRATEEAKAELKAKQQGLEAQKKVDALLRRLGKEQECAPKLLQDAERFQQEFAERKEDFETEGNYVQAKFYEELIERQANGMGLAALGVELAEEEMKLEKMSNSKSHAPARAQQVDAIAALRKKIKLEGLNKQLQQLNEGSNLTEHIGSKASFMQQRIDDCEGDAGWNKNALKLVRNEGHFH